MTIAERIQQQVRTCNRIKWGGILVLVIVAFQQTAQNHSNSETYAWMAAVTIPWLAVYIAFVRRVRCPRCQKAVFQQVVSSVPTPFTVFRDAKRELGGKQPLALDACPQCGCMFSEPYVGG